MNIKHINKGCLIYIYDSYENQDKLDNLYNVLKPLNAILISLSQRELKLVKTLDIKNLVSYDEFMKGDHILFRRITTAYRIKLMSNNYTNVFRHNGLKFLNKLNTMIIDEFYREIWWNHKTNTPQSLLRS